MQANRNDFVPGMVLLGIAVVFATFTAAREPMYLNAFNLQNLSISVAALGLIALGQLVVVLTGGIDLSVGPLAGLLVVVMSFTMDGNGGSFGTVLGTLPILAVAVAVGLINGMLVSFAKMPPIIVTVATFIALQGVSLMLRPTAGGSIDSSLTVAIQSAWGPVGVAFMAVLAIGVGLERMLRKSIYGLHLRSVGSSVASSLRLGVDVPRTVLLAYVLSSLLTCLGALVLAGQVGIGDPTLGVGYSLSSISAVVLAGASIYGGRGSFIGVLCGALLLALLANASSFLGLHQAWQSWLPGGLMLVATAITWRVQRSRSEASSGGR